MYWVIFQYLCPKNLPSVSQSSRNMLFLINPTFRHSPGNRPARLVLDGHASYTHEPKHKQIEIETEGGIEGVKNIKSCSMFMVCSLVQGNIDTFGDMKNKATLSHFLYCMFQDDVVRVVFKRMEQHPVLTSVSSPLSRVHLQLQLSLAMSGGETHSL